MNGYINSFQSMGAVDGPGLRYVIFMQGCPLRCACCHNPETWQTHGGTEMSVDDVVKKAMRFAPYFKNGGGVTVSGGEALMQWQFVRELFSELRSRGIHTALDTSGAGDLDGAAQVLDHTDLVICDIKYTSEDMYRRYCGAELAQVLDFLKLTESKKVPLWVRQVIIPGLNDSESDVQCLKEIAGGYSNLEKIELLAFKKLCIEKYEDLGLPFKLANVPECSPERLSRLQKLI